MSELNAEAVLARLGADLPEDARSKVIVVGSLAAAYAFRAQLPGGAFTTKDADLVLSPPQIEAVTAAQRIAKDLLAENWTHRGSHGGARLLAEPADQLAVIRLYPPESNDYFIELLTAPNSESEIDATATPAQRRTFVPVELADGFWSLVQFDFLALTTWRPPMSPSGVAIARPSLLALSNLLAHPVIGHATMSQLIGGQRIKRANKDLGRALALARLAIRASGPDVLEAVWLPEWIDAVADVFPTKGAALVAHLGDGLRELLASPQDLAEAAHTCNYGLLSSAPVTTEELRTTGARVLAEVIGPFLRAHSRLR